MRRLICHWATGTKGTYSGFCEIMQVMKTKIGGQWKSLRRLQREHDQNMFGKIQSENI
jgi:hypothetical protein